MSANATITENVNTELHSKTDTNEVGESQGKESSKHDGTKAVDDERIAKIVFYCVSCELQEMVHYFGKQPPFVYGVEFSEPTYVMRDPFQAPISSLKSKAEYFVAIGAHCRICNKVVCKDMECSFFYNVTYCMNCASKSCSNFPLDIQRKLKKIT